MTWLILIAAAAGGIYWYRKQPTQRRERIKGIASDIGTGFMEEYTAATGTVQQAQLNLRACLVPNPRQRSTLSAILRALATAPESLSAQQLADRLDVSPRPCGRAPCLPAGQR